jgi:hypothetical protein
MSRKKKTGGQTKKTFKPVRCSPKPVGERKNINKKTCYNDQHLYTFKKMWNSKHPDDQILTENIDEIWSQLKEKFSKICDKESCWYKQFSDSNFNESEMRDLFAPSSPSSWEKNPNEWLSSTDIVNVMKQYKKIYKCFEFIGPSPIDYDFMETETHCVWDELCKFNLKHQIDNGKFKIGISFNTDKHDGPGIHWVSLFVNIKKGIIFYFDSAGNEVKPSIKRFANNIIKQGKELSPPIEFKFDQNYPKQHQYTSTECGMYSLYFIVQMLEDKVTTKYLKTHVLSDKFIERFRKIYFNPA